MRLSNRRDPNRHDYSRVEYFSASTVRLFRILAIFVTLCGALLVALCAVTVFTTTKRGGHYPLVLTLVSLLGGVLAIWGRDFGHGVVTVSPTQVRTRNHIHRSARKDEIDSLDIIHTDHLGSESTTPTLFLRNGKSIVLEPLIWSERVGSEQPGWTFRQQEMVVKEIREILRVGGHD